jgi:hypothetical protein
MSEPGYYCTVGEYTEQIRNWAVFDTEYRRHRGGEPVDPNVLFNFARVAAVWERLRWDIHTRGASPGDRNRLDELTEALQGLATTLGLGTVDPDGFLPGDPARLLAGRRGNAIDPWHEWCMYAPKES